MARKRLYHTHEERLAANKLAAKRYREKHTDELRRRRQERNDLNEDDRARERKEKREGLKDTSTSEGSEVRDSSSEAQDISRYSYTMKRARRIHAEFVTIVQNRAFFVETVYNKFTTPVPYEGYLPPSFLDESSQPFDKMERELKNMQRHIQHSGPYSLWKEVDDMRIEIEEVVRWINDIHCEFLDGGILGLHEAHDLKQLGHTKFL
ncbi:hypothetical protein PM082_001344 [Marasmius tenuissimus]|nr:hypothetical protein PM082_001344 [Marasmius tenuissimus]